MFKMIRFFMISAVAITMTLTGCNVVGSIINPIVGTWETTIGIVAVTETYNADGSFSETNSLGSLGITSVGTWKNDSQLLTKTWTGSGDTTVYTYSFNSDKTVMTLASGGISLSYTKQ